MRNFICWCFLLALVIGPSLLTHAQLGSPISFLQQIGQKKFQKYLSFLLIYQDYHPESFFPPDLINWNTFPPNELIEEINRSLKIYSELLQKKKSEDIQIAESRAANQRLLRLVGPKFLKSEILGSQEQSVQAMAPQTRRALTPCDDIFFVSVIGKKLRQEMGDLSKRIIQFKINSDESMLRFTAIEKGVDEYFAKPQYFYLKKIRSKGKKLTLRLLKGRDKERLGPDLTIEMDHTVGSFFNDKTNSRSIFGRLPVGDQIFTQDGQQHFSGDGHFHN